MGTERDVWDVVQSAWYARVRMDELSREQRAAGLDAVAQALAAERDAIITTTSGETALTPEELAPEFLRMVKTFRMFAGVVREGSWVRAAVDRRAEEAGESIGPNHDVRRLLRPLRVVAVFGASNFPLSYGVCGGDTASALAAGCAVVVKEHPAHPRTGRLLHSIASWAFAETTGVAALEYANNEDVADLRVAERLLQHEAVEAVGFTGSVKGGLAIERLARSAYTPKPVFAEMGSNNVVVVSTDAAKARGETIAAELAAAILARCGQQCTRPGTIVVPHGDAGDRLITALGEKVRAAPGRDMLAAWIRDSYQRRCSVIAARPGVRLAAEGGARDGPRGAPARLFVVDDSCVQDLVVFNEELREEVFGPAALVVRLPIDRVSELTIFGALTYTYYLEPSDIGRPNDWYLEHSLMIGRRSAGRVVFNGVPTGVRVAHGMVHSGPYPACNRPDTTAVGPFAIERWCRPVCFQNAPQELLPEELRDGNPLGIGRFEDGVWVAGRGPQGSGG